MSICITTDVFCDRCSCWIHGTTGPRTNATAARKAAKRAGWKVGLEGATDLCAECLAEDQS